MQARMRAGRLPEGNAARGRIMGAHDGHRGRMRDKIEKTGLGPLPDHEVLEYMLFPFVPRRNTNETGHDLMNKFGSFADVFNADLADIESVPGMTHNAALFFSVMPEIIRRYIVSVAKKRPRLSGRRAVRDYIGKEMFGMPVEAACAAALDAQDGLIRFERLAVGTGDGVDLSVRAVVEFALRTNAVSVVLAHNHPSGNTRPSQSDYDMTLEISDVLGSIGVRLADHIVYTGTESFSFEENGLLGTCDAFPKR